MTIAYSLTKGNHIKGIIMKSSLMKMALLTSGLLFANTSIADVTANIGANSNYLWRGVTQTDDGVAVQGGLDYSHESGFYAGSWASNVDFGDSTSYEVDLYTGYSGTILDDISYDLGYLYYGYPDADGNINFGELSISASFKWLEVGYSHVIHADEDLASPPLDNKDLSYLQANMTFPLSDTLSLVAHYGYSSGDVVQSWFGGSNYADYHLALSAETPMGTVSFMLSDTDLKDQDTKVVLGYNYTFDL
jgi:uncharacterized protein (TIGR02001 family)